jgi:hypothetical protein
MKKRKFNYLTIRYSPMVLYNFNGTLEDFSGDGYNLSLGAGTERYMTIDGFTGFYFSGTEYLSKSFENPFINFGAITIESIILLPETFTTNAGSIAICGGNTESSSGNQTWGLLSNSTTVSGTRIQYLAEYGSGTNITFNSTAPFTVGEICHATLTRDSSGTIVKCYINGKLFSTSGVLNAPNGTTTCNLIVGADVSGSNNLLNGTVLFSVKVINSQLTDDQILEEYNYSIGKFW